MYDRGVTWPFASWTLDSVSSRKEGAVLPSVYRFLPYLLNRLKALNWVFFGTQFDGRRGGGDDSMEKCWGPLWIWGVSLFRSKRAQEWFFPPIPLHFAIILRKVDSQKDITSSLARLCTRLRKDFPQLTGVLSLCDMLSQDNLLRHNFRKNKPKEALIPVTVSFYNVLLFTNRQCSQ